MIKKISLIIKREYLTRVRKRSFIVMTILGPLLMAGMVIVPVYLATHSNDMKTISVIDETGFFTGKFKDSDNMKFHYLITDIYSTKENFSKSGDYALLYIPKTELNLPSGAYLYSSSQVNMNVKGYITGVMSKQLEELKLEVKLNDLQEGRLTKIKTTDILQSIKSNVNLITIKIGKGGKEEKSYPEVSMILGTFSSILVYFFIFLFGAQVMRGVIEEKTNRIIEVMVSSVKPFELMMGKIIGVALVGLTQFLLWVVLTGGLITVFTSAMASKNLNKHLQENVITAQSRNYNPDKLADLQELNKDKEDSTSEILNAIGTIDFPVMIASFIFYFLFGYLLYASLFAAIGSAVDSDSDTQQFMLPITMPLIFAIIMAQAVVQEPQGSMAFWLSIIPLTSPVIMMIRIPFGVPYLDLVISMTLLILGFLGSTWLAAKIYRTGILMYGKKVSYRELWKWIRYKG